MRVPLVVQTGSRAYGVANSESDYDYMGVYVPPTKDIMSVGSSPDKTIDLSKDISGVGEADITLFEIGHFLSLAMKSNPTILAVFRAPLIRCTKVGEELRGLFPYVWGSREVLDSHVGYAESTKTRVLSDKATNPRKAASDHVRVLNQGIDLLSTGSFDVKLSKQMRGVIKRIREGETPLDDVWDIGRGMKRTLMEEYAGNPLKEPDKEAINEFLVSVSIMDIKEEFGV